MQNVLVLGGGYSGERLALRHRERGDAVAVTSRDPGRLEALAEAGITLLETRGPLPRVQRVYYTIPPLADETGKDQCLAEILERLPAPEVFVYFGTTGVYGDCDGERVNEASPTEPASERARRRLAAEAQVREQYESGDVRAVLLRIAGIYGPGRLPTARLRRGEPVPEPAATGPGNRIHVDDLVSAAMAIADSREQGIFNISDGNPLTTAEFNDRVAAAINLPLPRRVPLDSPEISEGMRSFLRERREIDNSRLLSLPGFTLRYADPVEGIRASLD